MLNLRRRVKRRLPERVKQALMAAPKLYAELWYKSPEHAPKLYPQTANGNPFQIEESRLVDKIFENQNDH